MKYVITFFALFTIYIYGCGDDNTTNTNNNGNGETVIFSMDSLSIYLTSNIEAKDTNIVITNAPNVKVTFNCSTNADSISTFALYRIIAFDSTNFFIDSVNNHISKLNTNHSISTTGSNNYNLKILIQASRGNATPCFIKLSNIKIIKF